MTHTPRRRADITRESQEFDANLLNRLKELAQQPKPIGNYAAIGEPLRASRKRVASGMERLEKAGAVKIRNTSGNRTISIVGTDLVVRVRPASGYQWTTKGTITKARMDSAANGNIPPDAAEAIATLRRRGYIAYAERVSERGLALTGLFIVGRRSVDLEELLEMAGVQRAA